MDYGNFLDACRSLASSAGEFASLLVVALVSYLLVVLRSLVAKVKALSLTNSPSVSAPVPRARRSRAPRSSASPTGLAVSPAQPHPSRKVVENGISEEVPPLSQVERFVFSIEESELGKASIDVRRGADYQDSVGRAESAAGRRSDDGRPDDGGGRSAPGGVLAGKRP